MTQGIEARQEGVRPSSRGRPHGPGSRCAGPTLGIAGVVVAAAAFLLHQLMAWPPHEDETLALFIGRDSLPGVVEHVTRDRGGAPLHFLLAWAVAHLGFGLAGLRLLSASFAIGSLPLVAALGTRLADVRVGFVATVVVAPSWLFLFHGVYGRMYSLFLFLSLACLLALLRALDRGGRGAWALWVATALLTVADAPVRRADARRPRPVRAPRAARPHPRGGARRGGRARARRSVLATDLVLAGRFDVGVGGGGAKLGGRRVGGTYGGRPATSPPGGGRCRSWPRPRGRRRRAVAPRRERSFSARWARPLVAFLGAHSAARPRRSRGT